jgi:hypothetical protein
MRRDLLIIACAVVGAAVGYFAFGGEVVQLSQADQNPEAALAAIGAEPIVGLLLGLIGVPWIVNRHLEGGRPSGRTRGQGTPDG